MTLLWLVTVLISVSKLSSGANNSSERSAKSDVIKDNLERLNQALKYVDESKRRIDGIQAVINESVDLLEEAGGRDREKILTDIETRLIESIKEDALQSGAKGIEMGGGMDSAISFVPANEYEQLRRQVKNNVKEFWYYAQNAIKKLAKKGADPKGTPVVVDEVLSMLTEHKNNLLNDMERIEQVDAYEGWREKEAQDLTDLVQRRLHYLQNPENCSKARKLVCRLNKGCGFGCQLHHVVYCFIMAYATERTLILKSQGWRYHTTGWEEIFKPLSDTCLNSNGNSHANWPETFDVQVVTLPIIDSLNPRPPYLPLAIPSDLAPRLGRIHGNPIVWWIGQFLKYLLRLQPKTQAMIDEGIAKLNFKSPIVGVHVRRTDKVGTEAAFHGIDEYMEAVDDFYDKYERTHPNLDKRRVFIASDDPEAIKKARSKYTNYEVIGDPNAAKLASVGTRYSDSSLNGIILDTYLLSRSDYLVCTFSSQVCRLAYEIMQTLHTDATDRFRSLDDIYYYGGQNPHNREVIIPHKARNSQELNLRVGDAVGVEGNHWDGFSKGKNENTNQNGLFPSFKVIDKVQVADFPNYSHVK